MRECWRIADSLWNCINPELPGIFSRLEVLGVPWSQDIPGTTLDAIYLGNHSGGKPPAPIIQRWIVANECEPLTSNQMDLLAGMIHAMNAADWARLWAAEIAEYNPLSNYDMRETLEDEKTREETGEGSVTYGKTKSKSDSSTTGYGSTETRTDNLTDGYDSTTTRTDNLIDGYGSTETRTDNLQTARTGTETTATSRTDTGTTESIHSVYGLNSATGAPSDKDEGETSGSSTGQETLTHNTTDSQTGTQATGKTGSDTHTGTQATAKTGSDTHTGTQATAKTGSDTFTGTGTETEGGSDTREDSKTENESHSYTLTRAGNIGVTTAQDMLTQERALRAWRFFYDRVFPDVDRLLTLCIY